MLRKPAGGRVRVDRPLACAAITALVVALLFRADGPNVMFVGAPVAAGAPSLLLTRRLGWWSSYVANGRGAVAGAAVAAASVAAIVDPSEHESNLIVFTFGAVLFVGSLAAAGVVVAVPAAWAWARWRRGPLRR